MDELFSIEETARGLGGLSRYTAEAWLSKGLLPRAKVGAHTIIRESDLRALISSRDRKPATPLIYGWHDDQERALAQ